MASVAATVPLLLPTKESEPAALGPGCCWNHLGEALKHSGLMALRWRMFFSAPHLTDSNAHLGLKAISSPEVVLHLLSRSGPPAPNAWCSYLCLSYLNDDYSNLQAPWLFCRCCAVSQSHPTLCDPLDCSPPGSPVHGILQARILEGVAMPSSRGSSPPRCHTYVSCIAGGFFTHTDYQHPFIKTKPAEQDYDSQETNICMWDREGW